jgi:type IV secretory pathway VirB3-like protein
LMIVAVEWLHCQLVLLPLYYVTVITVNSDRRASDSMIWVSDADRRRQSRADKRPFNA